MAVRLFLSISLIGLLTLASSAAADPLIRILGGPRIVSDYVRDHCHIWDVPDAPARAFRNAAGQTRLFVSSADNRSFVVENGKVRKDGCRVAFPSGHQSDPAAYNDLNFLTAFWTSDGVTVHALVHREYHAERHKACSTTSTTGCWYNTVGAAESIDGGYSFRPKPGSNTVAAPPFRQEEGQGRNRGFFNPSNIVEKDGFLFSLVFMASDASHGKGICLIRTSDITDPAEWRGFSGNGFDVEFPDPYGRREANGKACQPIKNLTHYVGSVSRIESGPWFVALMITPADRRTGLPDGVKYSLSTDLVNWTKPELLVALTESNNPDCRNPLRYAYPSLIDFSSTGRNYDRVGARPTLFLTQLHTAACKLTPQRDLVAYDVEIVNSP